MYHRNNDTCMLILKSFINAEISKAIIIQSRMRNRFLNHRTDGNRPLFHKQRNKCASLLRESQKRIFLIIECKESSRQ